MKQTLLDQYDWIILGDHPAGFWTALCLIDAGLNVLLVPHLGHALDSSSHHQESNWYPDYILENAPTTETVQVITPERRVSVYESDSDFRDEWKLQFGTQIKPESWDHPAVKDLVKGLAFIFRGHDLSPVQADDWKKILPRLKTHLFYPDGRDALKQTLKELVLKKGGRVVEENACQQIFVDAKGIKGIQLVGVSNIISTSAALLTVNWDHSQKLFSQNTVPSAPAASAIQNFKSEPYAWWFTLRFDLPLEMMPPGVTSKMIYAEENAPVIEIERLSGANEKEQQWVARTLLPYHPKSLQRDEQRKVAQRLFKKLESIFPFIEYAVSTLSPDLRDPEQVEEFDLVELYPFRDLDQIPSELLAYGGKGLGYQTPYPGLYLADDESFPKWGDLGAYHAAATAVLEWAKKNQKVLPDTLKKALIV